MFACFEWTVRNDMSKSGESGKLTGLCGEEVGSWKLEGGRHGAEEGPMKEECLVDVYKE